MGHASHKLGGGGVGSHFPPNGIGTSLISVHLMGVHSRGVPLIGVALIDVPLMSLPEGQHGRSTYRYCEGLWQRFAGAVLECCPVKA